MMWHLSVFVYSYDFQPHEFVNSLQCVTLETQSTETGNKDFIAVGTTINRGEDLAVKGAVRKSPLHRSAVIDNLDRHMSSK